MACACNQRNIPLSSGRCRCSCGNTCSCHSQGVTTSISPCEPKCALPSPCDAIMEARCVIKSNVCYLFNWYGSQVMPGGLTQEALNQYLLNLIAFPSNMASTASCPIVYYANFYMHNGNLVVEFLPAINETAIISYSIQLTNTITNTVYNIATIVPGSSNQTNGYYYYTIAPTTGIPFNAGDIYSIQIISNSTGGTCHGLDYRIQIDGNKNILSPCQ